MPDPAAADTEPLRVDDLLYYVDPRPDALEGELRALARHLYPQSESRETSLTQDCRLAFFALCSYLFDNYQEEQALGFPHGEHPTIGTVVRLASLPRVEPGTGHHEMCRRLKGRKFLSAGTKASFSHLLQLSERRLRLVMETLAEGLQVGARAGACRLH